MNTVVALIIIGSIVLLGWLGSAIVRMMSEGKDVEEVQDLE